MGDDSPFAEGQGQTAGTGTELVTTGAQAAVIENKKRKCTVTKAQMAGKAGSIGQSQDGQAHVTGRIAEARPAAQSGSHDHCWAEGTEKEAGLNIEKGCQRRFAQWMRRARDQVPDARNQRGGSRRLRLTQGGLPDVS